MITGLPDSDQLYGRPPGQQLLHLSLFCEGGRHPQNGHATEELIHELESLAGLDCALIDEGQAHYGVQFGPISSRSASGVAHRSECAKRFTQSGPAPIFTRSGVNSGESVLAINA